MKIETLHALKFLNGALGLIEGLECWQGGGAGVLA